MHSGIVIDIDPVLFAAGPVIIRWYGVMISIGIVAGAVLGMREARRRGISEDDILYLLVWAVPAALVGARLFHVVDAWDYYLTYPLQILAIQEGGLAIYGGLIGGLLAGAWAARRKGILSLGLLDLAAPSLILGQAIGRIGCFVNGDHQGPPSDLPWATSYVHTGNVAPDSQPRQPAQLYEMLYDLAILGLLMFLRPRLKKDGILFALYAALYSFGRFWISALRGDALFLAGLKEAQLISVVTFLVAVPVMVYIWRRPAAQTSAESRVLSAERTEDSALRTRD
ncbi:MAG TPA: prolipoprotein diacylglyceryl transferase [Chloroflexota bacterium]